jgi:hypothetical protein
MIAISHHGTGKIRLSLETVGLDTLIVSF